jgi:hypothetical protein
MKKNNKKIDQEAQWARWIALYEAVNIIIDKAESKNIKLEDIVFKPLDIKDYIASTEDIILRKLLKEQYNIDVAYKEEPSNKEEYQFI